ncbi:hypothetical protein KQX63_06865 [Rhodopseudomonas palustris]|uniref:hypothetical protein n=1 Tax=Rhodopseudomonas palustris TaxID=1076 RepID=UPI0021F27501|nr:hypothetical protein [Rhodopseudomonas palustris]UYO45729.1 hypothetical protein KQX63_06865 [Rhodopseudomonas palustris]
MYAERIREAARRFAEIVRAAAIALINLIARLFGKAGQLISGGSPAPGTQMGTSEQAHALEAQRDAARRQVVMERRALARRDLDADLQKSLRTEATRAWLWIKESLEAGETQPFPSRMCLRARNWLIGLDYEELIALHKAGRDAIAAHLCGELLEGIPAVAPLPPARVHYPPRPSATIGLPPRPVDEVRSAFTHA